MANIGDESQVKSQVKKQKFRRDNELADLRAILSTGPGQRVIWRFLEQAGVFNSIWTASAQIHYNAGKQDFGHFILAEIIEADESALFRMMSEGMKKKSQEESND